MSEWRKSSIADLAQGRQKGVAGGPFGSALGRKDYVDEGVPVIRGSQLSEGGQFSSADFVFVTNQKADRHRGNLAYPGEVVVTQRGTIGQVGLIPKGSPYDRYLLSQSQMKISPDPSRVDSEFLYFALCSPANRQRLINHAMTAGVPHINLATLREFQMLIPDLTTQRGIATVLSAFDELIQINERRIELLEDLARSLYREWFVRFRFPGHEAAGLTGPTAESAPAGWKVRRASEVFRINPRIRPAQSAFPKVTMADVDERISAVFSSTVTTRVAGSKFQRDDVLFARITPCLENGKTALVKFLEPGEVAIGSTEFIVLRGATVGPTFVYCAARSERVRHHAIKSMSGSSGRQRVATSCFNSLELVEPPRAIANQFEQVAGPMFDEVFELANQNRHLATTRDLLLPRLVEGRIHISDVDLGDLLPAETA